MQGIKNREEYILHLLEINHNVTTEQLCDIFGITPSSVRRQLADMEKRGLLIRRYGGATGIDSGRDESVDLKSTQNTNIKKEIATVARRFIHDGDAIALGGGTTVAELCNQLLDLKKSVVYTDSLLAANILKKNPDIELWINSGIVRDKAGYIVGPSATELFKTLRIDKAFIGVDGFDIVNGVYSNTFANAIVERAMVDAAQEVFVLFDHTKFNRRATTAYLNIDQVDYIVTDMNFDSESQEKMKEHGIEILVSGIPYGRKLSWRGKTTNK